MGGAQPKFQRVRQSARFALKNVRRFDGQSKPGNL
jgi:hypothetical protein